MHLLGLHLRDSTRSQYASGRSTYGEFCKLLDVEPYPAAPALLMDFAIWCTLVKKLDSSTTANKLRGIFYFYDYIRTRLCFRHVRNHSRDPELIELIRSLGINFKKPGGGRLPLSAAELSGLFQHGFTARTRRGRWARIFGLCLNFAMLRSTAVSSLIVRYTIVDGIVIFADNSEVTITWNYALSMEVVEFRILSDKNVDARRAAEEGGRRAYVPGDLPALQIALASDLRSYLLDLRPPSGGPLCAYPDKKGVGFSSKASQSFNTYLREAYKKAFPDVSAAYLSRIGSHSGRKTLSQLLWEHGFSRQLIADAGGWYIKREAVDLYFRTSALLILRALLALRIEPLQSIQGPFLASSHQQS